MKIRTIVLTMACLIVLGGGCASDAQERSEGNTGGPLTIGAILPLTGPGAFYGTTMMNSMRLAQEELAREGVTIDLFFEDSQGLAKEGVNAYNTLTNKEDIDVLYVAFSRVAMPIIPLAEAAEIPMFMSLVAAEGAADMSPYTFRLFSQPKDLVKKHFEDSLVNAGHTRIAVLHIDDEYGASINVALEDLAATHNVEIVATEGFEPGTTDFRTALTKIKAAAVDALFIAPVAPPETINLVKQIGELGLDVETYEASLNLSSLSNRNAVGDLDEGIFANAYGFALNKGGESFRAAYASKHDEAELNLSSPLAYDTVRLLGAATGGHSADTATLLEQIHALGEFDSINGTVTIQENGEINPPVYSVRIENNELIEVGQ